MQMYTMEREPTVIQYGKYLEGRVLVAFLWFLSLKQPEELLRTMGYQ